MILVRIILNVISMDWYKIISNRTPVRTKDSTTFGYVAGQYKDNLVVIEGKTVSHEYAIPKDKVEKYDGQELSLKMRHDEINSDYQL
jgi:hypothetical protein